MPASVTIFCGYVQKMLWQKYRQQTDGKTGRQVDKTKDRQTKKKDKKGMSSDGFTEIYRDRQSDGQKTNDRQTVGMTDK